MKILTDAEREARRKKSTAKFSDPEFRERHRLASAAAQVRRAEAMKLVKERSDSFSFQPLYERDPEFRARMDAVVYEIVTHSKYRQDEAQ